MIPVLNVSNFIMDRALCEKDKASMSVISADFLSPGRNVYRSEGTREGKKRTSDGVLKDRAKSSM